MKLGIKSEDKTRYSIETRNPVKREDWIQLLKLEIHLGDRPGYSTENRTLLNRLGCHVQYWWI
jgi:hypothetical protein